MTLPLARDYAPMEAQLVDELPVGPAWQYEPKWDGFRCIAFRDGAKVDLMSKAGKPLTRYAVLVVPNWEQLEKWAKIKNLLWTDRSQLLEMPIVHAKMEKEVFGKLQGLAKFETPKKVALLEHDFSIERGELTPTLKVKRRVIDRTYHDVIDRLYEDEHAAA